MSPPPTRCDGPDCTTEATTTRDVPEGWVADPHHLVLVFKTADYRLHRAALLCPGCQRKKAEG